MNWILKRQKKTIPGKRWWSIGMRTLHLLGICGLAGAYLFQQPEAAWFPYLLMTVLSGLVMAGLEIYSNPIWLLQLRGHVIGIKLLLLSTMTWWFEQPNSLIYIFIIVISGVVSHAPGRLRYYSVFYRRVLTEDIIRKPDEIKDCGG